MQVYEAGQCTKSSESIPTFRLSISNNNQWQEKDAQILTERE